jgi:hypothetical protein
MASLWKPECTCIDDAITPGESERLKLIHKIPHGATTLQLQHEWDILEYQPAQVVRLFEKSKYLSDQAGVAATDTNSPSSLAQVLTGEASGYDIDPR